MEWREFLKRFVANIVNRNGFLELMSPMHNQLFSCLCVGDTSLHTEWPSWVASDLWCCR